MNVRIFFMILLLLGLASCAMQSIGRVDKDNSDRVKLIDAAERGDPQAQFELGNALCCGSGFYSTSKALQWWCRAAAQGHNEAMDRIANHSELDFTQTCTLHDPANRYET